MTKYTDKATEFVQTLIDAHESGGSNIGGGIKVGTFADLQDLIDDASSGDTIVLNKDYKYDSTTDSNFTSGIEINNDLTIIGNGHIIDGNNSKRAFYIQDYIVNLYDLRIQNCDSNGNGGAIFIYSGATVYISNVQFINNNATNYGDGGAIFIDYDATVKINNTQFNKNIANHYGGAISIDVANVTLENLSFRDNTASSYANIKSHDTITVYDCIIPNIATSCYNVSNITTESLYDSIEGLEEDMLR